MDINDAEDIQISDHLQDFDKKKGRGSCKYCGKKIQWSRLCVVSHKMRACPKTPAEEKSVLLQIYKKDFAMKQKNRRKRWEARRKGNKTKSDRRHSDEDDDEDNEDEEDQLVNEIVGCIQSGNIPIETVENKSFQKILNLASMKKKLSKLKAENIREMIREGVDDDFEMEESHSTNIKTEIDDEGNVTEVWLNSFKSDDEYEAECLAEIETPTKSSPRKKSPSNLKPKSDKIIDRKLTEMLISSSTPLELVDHPTFRSFIEAINPNYRLPNSFSLKSKLVEFIRKDLYIE